jgi:hypothetical protein
MTVGERVHQWYLAATSATRTLPLVFSEITYEPSDNRYSVYITNRKVLCMRAVDSDDSEGYGFVEV